MDSAAGWSRRPATSSNATRSRPTPGRSRSWRCSSSSSSPSSTESRPRCPTAARRPTNPRTRFHGRCSCPASRGTSRACSSGSVGCGAVPVKLRVPQRGDKKRSRRPSNGTRRRRWRSTSCGAPATSRRDLQRCKPSRRRSISIPRRCESSVSTSATCRARCRGVPRGVRGRSAAQVRLPALRDPEAAGDGRSDDVASIAEVTRRRFLRHNRDVAAGGGADGGDQAPKPHWIRRRDGHAGSRIRRTCSSSTAAPRRSTRPRGARRTRRPPTSR